MKVVIKNALTGERFPLIGVHANDTVETIKLKILEQTGISIEMQRLSVAGTGLLLEDKLSVKQLTDRQILAEITYDFDYVMIFKNEGNDRTGWVQSIYAKECCYAMVKAGANHFCNLITNIQLHFTNQMTLLSV